MRTLAFSLMFLVAAPTAELNCSTHSRVTIPYVGGVTTTLMTWFWAVLFVPNATAVFIVVWTTLVASW